MQPPVQIKKTERSLRVSFSYNSDLVDIMREEDGLWHRKDKNWIFPLSKLSQIREALVSKKYRVKIISETNEEKSKRFNQRRKKSREELFKDKDIISVWGVCSSCKQECFIGKDGICTRCSFG